MIQADKRSLQDSARLPLEQCKSSGYFILLLKTNLIKHNGSFYLYQPGLLSMPESKSNELTTVMAITKIAGEGSFCTNLFSCTIF
jgi:hypothetical protein